jgi:hypothetical protein
LVMFTRWLHGVALYPYVIWCCLFLPHHDMFVPGALAASALRTCRVGCGICSRMPCCTATSWLPLLLSNHFVMFTAWLQGVAFYFSAILPCVFQPAAPLSVAMLRQQMCSCTALKRFPTCAEGTGCFGITDNKSAQLPGVAKVHLRC